MCVCVCVFLKGSELIAGLVNVFRYDLDNKLDGFYIAPAFMDKLVVHITKNFLKLPNIKVCARNYEAGQAGGS